MKVDTFPMRVEIMRRVRSFQYAFAGWAYALRTQPNTWIHAAISVAVVLLGLWLQIDRLEWVAIVLTLVVVWTAEFVNTAIEAVVDMTMPKPHPLAKAAKDVAAAAVLISALGAVVVGLLILGPPLFARIVG